MSRGIDLDNRARWDAETLADAKTIEKDPERLNRAKDAAQKLADETSERANSMKAVATKRNGPRTIRDSNRNESGVAAFNVFKQI